MSFDEDVERIYTTPNAPGDYVAKELEKIIFRFPEEHRMLVGLRASFIKHRLIYEDKISFTRHTNEYCGVCLVVGISKDGPNCGQCPVYTPCMQRNRIGRKHNMMAAYGAYMKEHEKCQ